MQDFELEQEFSDEELSGNEDRRRLVYIPVEKIFPHPDNPRKELGDLTEIAESIIESGVLQNLTVIRNVDDSRSYEKLVDGYDKNGVRYSDAYIDHMTKHAFEGSYTVVIGHRRHGAAKLAGLAEVPCVISEMDYQTQIATMMAENLQRADLTVYEQAQGFQQMRLDLGMDVNRISAKTGFSVSTVRRRLKMADELNPDTLKRVSDRQITVEDLERLYKIEDPKLRDEALAEIGTANFAAKCEKALADQARAKMVAERKQICLSLGMTEISKTAVNDNDRYTYVCYCYSEPFRENLIEKLGDNDPKTLSFNVDQYGNASIRKKKESSVITAEAEKKQAQTNEKLKREERAAALDEAFKLAYRLRYDFIRRYGDLEVKKHIVDILEMAVEVNREEEAHVDMELFCEMNGFSETELEEANELPSFSAICGRTGAGAYQLLLTYLYATMGDSPRLRSYITNSWHARYGEYEEDSVLRVIYDGLCKLGYEMSDYEKALMDGTSELYYKKGDI